MQQILLRDKLVCSFMSLSDTLV